MKLLVDNGVSDINVLSNLPLAGKLPVYIFAYFGKFRHCYIFNSKNAAININYGVDYLYIGTGLIALGLLMTFTNLSLWSSPLLLLVLVTLYTAFMYRRILLHPDALSQTKIASQQRKATKHNLLTNHLTNDEPVITVEDEQQDESSQ